MAGIRFRLGKTQAPSGSLQGDMNAQMKQMGENLKKVLEAVQTNIPGALIHGVTPIFDESQRLVPVKTGRLKRSGFIRESFSTKNRVTVQIGYAEGGDPPYAAMVHEFTHLNHAAPTQAKFLEEAINRKQGEVGPRVQKFIQEQMGIV